MTSDHPNPSQASGPLPAHVHPNVAAWAATVPAGTSRTAAELLPSFLASGPPPDSGIPALGTMGVPWSPAALGMALMKLRGLAPYGVSRSYDRTGRSVWHFAGPA